MFLALIVLFQSCKKDKQNTQKESYNTYFKKMGKRHNNMLDYVASNCCITTATPFERYSIAKNKLNDNSEWSEIKQMYDFTSSIISNEFKSTNSQIESDYNQFSKEGIELINNLIDIFQDSFENQSITIQEFNQNVDYIIDNIYNNKEVIFNDNTNTGNEFAYIIAMCFQAKASFEYWYVANNDPDHPWYSFLHSDDNNTSSIRYRSRRRCCRWLRAALADVGGFFSCSDCLEMNERGTTTYDLGEAWNHAGEVSASVE